MGEVPHHLGRPLPGEAARLGKDRGKEPPQLCMSPGMQGAWRMDLNPQALHPTSDTKKSPLAAWHGLLSSNGNDNEGWVVATWVLHTCFTGIDNLLATL